MSSVSNKSSDSGFRRVVDRLRVADSLLAVTHIRPDGDAIGSAAGLARSAISAGKAVSLLVPDELPGRYEFALAGMDVAGAERFPELAGRAGLIVLLDTCVLGQLGDLAGDIGRYKAKTVVIDHHVTAEDIAADRWIDTSAAAVAVMVAEALDVLAWPVDELAAEALATGILADTGWLRFQNTDARCLRMLARLIDAGVRPDKLYRRLYQNDRPERLALLARALSSVELHCGGKLAVMTIRLGDFVDTGAEADETENMANEMLSVRGVELAVSMIEQGDFVRASLRSRGSVDVARLAKRFGGGGHSLAAGCRQSGDLGHFKARLIAACKEAIGG